jgi:hypothetical protein
MSRTKEQEPQAYEIFSELFKYDPSSLDDNSKSVFRNFRGTRILMPLRDVLVTNVR